MKKKRVNIEEAFNDPDSIRRSWELYKRAGTLKPEDYYERFTIQHKGEMKRMDRIELSKEQKEFLDVNVRMLKGVSCGQCGYPIDKIWHFCPMCGRSIL